MWMAELERNGVLSIDDDGCVYSRRMVRDEDLRQRRAEGGEKGAGFGHLGADHGKKGGRPRKETGDKKPPLEPPPSSSSSSSSSEQEEPKGSLPAKTGVPKCPHDEIIALYHEMLPANPGIKIWDGARANSLRARWREEPKRQSLDYWRRFFAKVAASAFLTGRAEGQRGAFLPGLDWMVKAGNFAKIIEGRYDDRGHA